MSEPRILRSLRIGIDVGGTNTDAVALDASFAVVASAKRPTTADVQGGMESALVAVLDALGDRAADVNRIMLGTTHATNAIVERRGLGRVALIRLGGPVSTAVPPLATWPDDLRDVVVGGVLETDGGFLMDGHPIAPIDVSAIAAFVESIDADVDAYAVSSVFGPIHPAQELEVDGLIRRVVGDDALVSSSHAVGGLGLLQRESATVLNAALHGMADTVVSALDRLIEAHGLQAQTYFAQNDGTLMDRATARAFPILTVGSGPSNSIRGAALLAGVRDAVVVDVGGTTTDLGVLIDGFARESSRGSTIGGVAMNFPMPDLLSIGFGGGTVLHEGLTGPESVGYRVTTDALVFGGGVPTLLDAAVAGGRTVAGTTAPPTGQRFVDALAEYDEAVADAILAMAPADPSVPVVVVGGGAGLVSDAVAAGRPVLRPARSGVANAAGAAIAEISGQYEAVIDSGSGRGRALEDARAIAVQRAISAGADAATVAVVREVETPLGYSTKPLSRLAVKAAGRLS